jgi:hypothetical protein
MTGAVALDGFSFRHLKTKQASSFAQDVENVSISKRPSFGQDAIELRASEPGSKKILFSGTC